MIFVQDMKFQKFRSGYVLFPIVEIAGILWECFKLSDDKVIAFQRASLNRNSQTVATTWRFILRLKSFKSQYSRISLTLSRWFSCRIWNFRSSGRVMFYFQSWRLREFSGNASNFLMTKLSPFKEPRSIVILRPLLLHDASFSDSKVSKVNILEFHWDFRDDFLARYKISETQDTVSLISDRGDYGISIWTPGTKWEENYWRSKSVDDFVNWW